MAENKERDYLYVLQHVLRHKNEDPLTKCQEIVYNIWNTLKKDDFFDEAKLESRFLAQELTSVNILLKVYEILYKEQISVNAPHFNIELINYLNDISNETSILSDCQVQNNLLQIVSTLLRIAMLENSQKNLNELAEFYLYNIKTMQNYTEWTDSCKVGLIFRLKIIYTIYESLECLSKSTMHEKHIIYINDKIKECKMLNNVHEFKSYVRLLLYSDEDVAITILLLLIPQWIKYFKESSILKYIWEEISHEIKPLTLVENKNQRILFILCHVVDLDSFFLKKEEKIEMWELFLKNSNFWLLIQMGLNEKDTLKRKQAMYLFKKSIKILEKNEITILTRDLENKKIIFFWDINFNCKLYQEIITVLEFLDEQQVHIIKPVFQMTYKLVEKLYVIFSDKTIDFSWILLIYEKALMHESIQVVKWGFTNLLQLPDFFFSMDYVLQKVVSLIVCSLNDLNIYYNEGLSVSEELIVFFKKMSVLKTSKIFFKLFINKVCNLIWSPEALFFVANALAKVPDNLFWENDEILKINKFISTALTTHNKVTKGGVLHLLLESVIKLTNTETASCDKVILLLSNFFMFEMGRKKKVMRANVIRWIRKSYSQEIAEKTLNEYKLETLSDALNEDGIAEMFILFYYAFGTEMTVDEDDFVPYCFASDQLVKMLTTFQNLEKRLYCDESLQIRYLSIVCKMIQKERENDEEESKLLILIRQFLTPIIQYIQSQVKLISDLKDFHKCKLYVKILENVLDCKLLRDGLDRGILKGFRQELEENLVIDEVNIPVIRIYCSLILLEVIVPYSEANDKNILPTYLVEKLNNSLEKEESYFESTKDIQSLWGRINSEYLKAKWVLYAHFFTQNENFSESFEENALFELCGEGLDIGGYGVLCPIMSVLRIYLPEVISNSEGKRLVDSIWNTAMERRKSDDFKCYISNFVDMLFQNSIYSKKPFWEKELIKYADLIFEDTSLSVVSIFMKRIDKLFPESSPFFLHVLLKGLLFGPMLKKEEKLTIQVWSYMTKDKIWDIGDYTTSNEIRARALQKAVKLQNSNFLIDLAEQLCMKANELSKNKVGYFGNSYIHRVKLRLMQSLFLFRKTNRTCEYVLNSLILENPQPSIKYLQEWYLSIHLLEFQRPSVLWTILHNPLNQKPKLICSILSIIYHLKYSYIVSNITELLSVIMPFCMDQNFEVRLYAQVIFVKMYEKYLKNSDKDWIFQRPHEWILESLNRSSGNARKNYEKLQKHFYFEEFKPLENVSLETLFVNLPRLTAVESDEWISVELFEFCGFKEFCMFCPNFKMKDGSLTQIKSTECLTQKIHSKPFGEVDELENNYQKKMIPSKSVLPQYDECDVALSSNTKNNTLKGSLVVVASLVERIPNLGGLVRTCEIFGATEFIVNSLKCLEEKQFTSLSVTAEKWISVKEVKSENLKEYILEMKKLGYTVVGAEQALYSQPLNDVKFPKKTLLLLGNEKEGIPPNLLPLLDHCIEIPQMGVIRSLNVHVTGALFIWEYAKQNCFL